MGTKYLLIVGIIAAALAVTMYAGSRRNGGGGEQGKTGTRGEESVMKKDGTEAVRERSQYVKMKPEEAKEMMESDQELILVDVRTPEEYKESRIGHAVNVPVEEIGEEQPEELPDLEAKILVYCRSGVRSKKAAKKLLDLGYKTVIDIGGIIDWPYETVSGEE